MRKSHVLLKVCTRTYWYVLTCNEVKFLYCHVQVCTGPYWYTRVHTILLDPVQVYRIPDVGYLGLWSLQAISGSDFMSLIDNSFRQQAMGGRDWGRREGGVVLQPALMKPFWWPREGRGGFKNMHAHTLAHARSHAHANARVHARTHTRTHTHARTHTQARKHAPAHLHPHAHTLTRTRSHARAHTHTRTHTHTTRSQSPSKRVQFTTTPSIRTVFLAVIQHSLSEH